MAQAAGRARLDQAADRRTARRARRPGPPAAPATCGGRTAATRDARLAARVARLPERPTRKAGRSLGATAPSTSSTIASTRYERAGPTIARATRSAPSSSASSSARPGAQAQERRLGVEVAADVGQALGDLGRLGAAQRARPASTQRRALTSSPAADRDDGGLVPVLGVVLREGLAPGPSSAAGARPARASVRASRRRAGGRAVGQVAPEDGQQPLLHQRGLGRALVGQQLGRVGLERGDLLLGEAAPLGPAGPDPAQVDLVAGLGQHLRQRAPGGPQRPGVDRRHRRGDRREVGDRRRDPGALGRPARQALGDRRQHAPPRRPAGGRGRRGGAPTRGARPASSRRTAIASPGGDPRRAARWRARCRASRAARGRARPRRRPRPRRSAVTTVASSRPDRAPATLARRPSAIWMIRGSSRVARRTAEAGSRERVTPPRARAAPRSSAVGGPVGEEARGRRRRCVPWPGRG